MGAMKMMSVIQSLLANDSARYSRVHTKITLVSMVEFALVQCDRKLSDNKWH